MENVEKEVGLSIIPFSSDIVGADEKYVYFKENYYVVDEMPEMKVGVSYNMADFPEDKSCCVKVLRKHFLVMVNKWLDSKADYCTRNNHFCGVFGSFSIEDYKQVGTINLLTGWEEGHDENDEGSPIYEDVPLFEVVKFSEYCDMEHG